MPPKPGYKQAPEHVARRIAARLATLKAKPRPVSREWLEREYVVNRRTCPDIAAELGRDPTTIWAWLRHYGIPTRPRGGASSAGSFQPGHTGTFNGRKHSEATKKLIREARLRDGRVPYLLPDGSHAMKGRTGADHPSWKGGITPERQAFYASEEWREACRAVWHRADARCQRCSADHREPEHRGTFHVHHIISFAVEELRAEVDNLALLCGNCHRFVHSRANTAEEFLGGHHARR